jgi:hypothetical protein
MPSLRAEATLNCRLLCQTLSDEFEVPLGDVSLDQPILEVPQHPETAGSRSFGLQWYIHLLISSNLYLVEEIRFCCHGRVPSVLCPWLRVLLLNSPIGEGQWRDQQTRRPEGCLSNF